MNNSATLEFKPDFAETVKSWQSFWDGTNNRPMLIASRRKPGMKLVEHPRYLECFDGDLSLIADKMLAYAETCEWLGDALPFYYLEFGPDSFAAYLGAELTLSDDRNTSWSEPFVEDWDRVEIKFQRESHWWQRTVEAIGILRSKLDGKILICPPALVANLDALAAIRGGQNLLFDMIDNPEGVKRAAEQVCRAHTEILQEYASLLDFDSWGSVNVESVYVDGKQSRPQCDMSCMISTEMFREFVMPCLSREADDTDTFHYHLDGPGAIQHLEALCSLPRLDTISFAKGAGNEDLDWTWLYDKVDQLGKGQDIRGIDKEKVKSLWRRYCSKKLMFHPPVDSKQEMDDLIGELIQGGKSHELHRS